MTIKKTQDERKTQAEGRARKEKLRCGGRPSMKEKYRMTLKKTQGKMKSRSKEIRYKVQCSREQQGQRKVEN